MIYPWQKQNWQQLIARYRKHNLPHAMLFTGIPGLGKAIFATNFAQFLLCNNNAQNDHACKQCTSCALFNANNHPDFLLVQPENAGKAIKVEQVRQMIEEMANTAHQGGARVVVINGAEAMNIAAANALLKTLEEPLGNVVIILVSARPSALPATILSRCQKVEFTSPTFVSALDWLKSENSIVSEADASAALHLAHNAPLKAVSLLQDGNLALRQEILQDLFAGWQKKNPQMHAIDFALTYTDIDNVFLLRLLMSIVADLLKSQLAISSEFITNVEQEKTLRDVGKYFSIEKLLDYQTYLLEMSKIVEKNITLNKQLLLENLWLRLYATLY